MYKQKLLLALFSLIFIFSSEAFSAQGGNPLEFKAPLARTGTFVTGKMGEDGNYHVVFEVDQADKLRSGWWHGGISDIFGKFGLSDPSGVTPKKNWTMQFRISDPKFFQRKSQSGVQLFRVDGPITVDFKDKDTDAFEPPKTPFDKEYYPPEASFEFVLTSTEDALATREQLHFNIYVYQDCFACGPDSTSARLDKIFQDVKLDRDVVKWSGVADLE